MRMRTRRCWERVRMAESQPSYKIIYIGLSEMPFSTKYSAMVPLSAWTVTLKFPTLRASRGQISLGDSELSAHTMGAQQADM